MVKQATPDRGDVVHIDHDPQAGHEQARYRPALVLSPKAYNVHGLMLCCPITTQVKGYPFEVKVSDTKPYPGGKAATGVVLADQLRCFDWRARKAELMAKAPDDLVAEVWAKLKVLLPK